MLHNTYEYSAQTISPKVDINALGQAIDTTWGRTSTPKTASYSVKMSLVGDCIQVSYAAIVNFATEREMIEMRRRYSDECRSVIDAHVKGVKVAYKDLSGKSLKLKDIGRSDSLEIISNSANNPKRTGYFRCKAMFQIA